MYVRTGLLWENAEIYWLGRFLAEADIRGCEPPTVLELPVGDLYGAHWSRTGEGVPGFDTSLDSNYLPGRNLLLLSKVAVFCALRGIPAIAMAPLSDNPFPDGTPAFFEGFARVAAGALDHGLTIEVPFRQIAKSEVIRRGRDLPLGSTFSCIQPSGLDHCGDCTKCAERQHGFATAGVADPTRYRNPAAPRSRSA